MVVAVRIKMSENAGRGRLYVELEDGAAAELNYRVAAGVMAIYRTYTPENARGRGIAGALTERAVELARDRELKIVPECPYVAAWFERHPAQADILAR